MKTFLYLSLILLIGNGCKDAYSEKPEQDIFYYYSEKFNENINISQSHLFKMEFDSATYYTGKAAAYYELEHQELLKNRK